MILCSFLIWCTGVSSLLWGQAAQKGKINSNTGPSGLVDRKSACRCGFNPKLGHTYDFLKLALAALSFRA